MRTLTGCLAIVMGKEMDIYTEIIPIEIHRDEAELAEQNIVRAKIPACVTCETLGNTRVDISRLAERL